MGTTFRGGVLHGFDRLRFRGTWQIAASVPGLNTFMRHMGVLLKDGRFDEPLGWGGRIERGPIPSSGMELIAAQWLLAAARAKPV